MIFYLGWNPFCPKRAKVRPLRKMKVSATTNKPQYKKIGVDNHHTFFSFEPIIWLRSCKVFYHIYSTSVCFSLFNV